MIIVKLCGGLGNQMFQYAAAKALSVTNNTKLKLDISHFDKIAPNQTIRSYSLNIFPNVKEEIAEKEEIRKIIPQFETDILNKIYKYINNKIFNFNKSFIIESDLSYSGISFKSKEPAYLEGYWQSEKYFKEQSLVIEDCFSLDYLNNNASLQSFIERTRSRMSISIHVRRGDYITNPSTNSYHGIAELSYYHRSIAKIAGLVSGNLEFFIFSDDIQWCRENLKIDHKHVYISTGEHHHDLYLMSCCRHNIIANSSFSWWAAWLNKNSDKIIIAPKKWFSNQPAKDVVPVNWITE
jgi:Glycosyl transferase family 11